MKLKICNEKYGAKDKVNPISFDIVDTETGELITPKFSNYTMKEHYEDNNILAIEPMTAKEYLDDAQLEEMLNSDEYYAEEKLDGTRATLHIGSDSTRIFSRRISKHTNWYVENTDSLPHLREIKNSDLDVTVLDGEMRIDGREFKEVSSTLNSNWDKAIMKQIEWGFITLHTFDIVYYKGVYVAKMPLWKRKKYLERAVIELNNPYIKLEEFSDTTITKLVGGKDNPVTKLVQYQYLNGLKELYPNLHEAIMKARPQMSLVDLIIGFEVELNKKAWYEFIVANGGEGLMLKHKNGTYKHTRGREYTKWKKFLTRDCIIMGFNEPTKEYKGKDPQSWEYYKYGEPISKFYAMGWVGNIRFGVVATRVEIGKLVKAKLNPVYEEINGNLVLEVGECSGFDEEQRKEFTDNKEEYIGSIIEILANEIFIKTGKLRHPRFLRCRPDKAPESCTWSDHVKG